MFPTATPRFLTWTLSWRDTEEHMVPETETWTCGQWHVLHWEFSSSLITQLQPKQSGPESVQGLKIETKSRLHIFITWSFSWSVNVSCCPATTGLSLCPPQLPDLFHTVWYIQTQRWYFISKHRPVLWGLCGKHLNLLPERQTGRGRFHSGLAAWRPPGCTQSTARVGRWQRLANIHFYYIQRADERCVCWHSRVSRFRRLQGLFLFELLGAGRGRPHLSTNQTAAWPQVWVCRDHRVSQSKCIQQQQESKSQVCG